MTASLKKSPTFVYKFRHWVLPYIDWIKKSAPEDSIHSVFLEFCNDRGMDQYVCEPTRNDHILDIILSNDPLIVNSADVKEPFSTSDHCSVYFDLVFSKQVNSHNSLNYNSTACVHDFDNYDVKL